MTLTCLRHRARAVLPRIIKRTMDIAGSATLLILLSPLLLATAVVILCVDGRPVFFKQRRVGKDGRIFKVWKFRTMRKRAELVQNLQSQAHKIDQSADIFYDPRHDSVSKLQRTLKSFSRDAKYPHDPRILPFARFMRKYSIDELPQFFQILFGDMSFIGPRPFVLYEVTGFSPRSLARHNVQPGLTGLWQISDRNRLQQDEAIGLDLQYVAGQGLPLDLKIIIKTVPAALGGNRGGN